MALEGQYLLWHFLPGKTDVSFMAISVMSSFPSVTVKVLVTTEINYHCNAIFLYAACVGNGVDCWQKLRGWEIWLYSKGRKYNLGNIITDAYLLSSYNFLPDCLQVSIKKSIALKCSLETFFLQTLLYVHSYLFKRVRYTLK